MAQENPSTLTMRAHSATERWLLKEIEKAIGRKPLSADVAFADLGMKPLDFIELVMAAEKALKLELPDKIVFACSTPAELARAIHKQKWSS